MYNKTFLLYTVYTTIINSKHNNVYPPVADKRKDFSSSRAR